MKNKLQDLNDHLFSQLERLNEETISNEDLEKEIKRGQSISAIAKDVVQVQALALAAAKLQTEYRNAVIPAQLKAVERK